MGRGSANESRRVRVGLLGAYHSRNLGDTAIQMAVLENLRSRWPDVDILGISWDPDDAARCHGIEAVSLLDGAGGASAAGTGQASRRFSGLSSRLAPLWAALARPRQLLRISKVVSTFDLLVISGGGQLDDFWGGPWRHPHALLAWTTLARLHRVPIAVFGVGIDDLDTGLGKRFAFTAMRLAQERYFRDAGTVEILRKAGVKGDLRIGPDPAFSLPVPRPVSQSQRAAGKTVMVCPITYKAWLKTPSHEYTAYLETLTAACATLMQGGARLQLGYSQSANDGPVAHDVASRLRAGLGSSVALTVNETDSVSSFLRCAGECDVVVGSRLHALILAAVAARPLVAVSYGRKVRQLMADLGLQRYALDLTSLQAPALATLVDEAWTRRDAISQDLLEVVGNYRRQLSEEYERLFTLTQPDVKRVSRDPGHGQILS